MITKETQTITDVMHTYKIPFNEFWGIIKDSKVINKSISYNPAYARMAGNDPMLSVSIGTESLLSYLKTIDIKGEIYLISDKGKYVEISSQERTVKK